MGDDLREGKPTPLIAVATARASAGDREMLRRLGSPDLTEADIDALQLMYVGILKRLLV